MKPTIYTIASQAGVSIATVSRAFNNSPRISQDTKSRILQIAEDMGYRPNAMARNLAMNTTGTLALVLPQLSGPYFSELIRGAESVARHNQYHLLIYSSSDLDSDDELLSILSTRTDGLVLSTYSSTNAYIRRLCEQRYPMVILGFTIPGLPLNAIYPDNQTGAYRLTRHLIENHGYRRIAFISGPRSQGHSLERLAGYKQALRESGIPEYPHYIADGDFEELSGYRCTHKFLSLSAPPKAIFAANDQTAIGAIAAAREKGYEIPGDLAVVGFDDIPSAQFLQPSLTTVSVSTYDQGASAVRQLLKISADPNAQPEEIVIPTTVVLRHSCGCR